MDADAALAVSPDCSQLAVAFSLRAPSKPNHFFQSPSKKPAPGDPTFAPIVVVASAHDLVPIHRAEVSSRLCGVPLVLLKLLWLLSMWI